MLQESQEEKEKRFKALGKTIVDGMGRKMFSAEEQSQAEVCAVAESKSQVESAANQEAVVENDSSAEIKPNQTVNSQMSISSP